MVFKTGQSNGVNKIYPWHGNEIWDKMGYNSASVRDKCEIFASTGKFTGLGHQMLPMKFYPTRPSLPWQ